METIPVHSALPAPITKSTCTGPSITLPATKVFAYATQVRQAQSYTSLKSQALLNAISVAHLKLIYQKKLMFGFVTPGHRCTFNLNKVPLAYCVNKAKIWDAKIARKITHLHDNLMGAAGICSTSCCAPQTWELVIAVLALPTILLLCPALKDLLVYDTCIARCEL